MNQEYLFLGNLNRAQIEGIMNDCKDGIQGELRDAKSPGYLRWLLVGCEARLEQLRQEESGESA